MSDGKFGWCLFICYYLIGTLFESVKNLTVYLYGDIKSYTVIKKPIIIDVYFVDALEKFPFFCHCDLHGATEVQGSKLSVQRWQQLTKTDYFQTLISKKKLVAYGYIRTIEKLLGDDIIPDSIIKLCCDY